jgi:hypothetical protein
MIASGVFMFGSIGFSQVVEMIAKKHRVSFSKLLTVSRVFLARESSLYPAYKQLKPDMDSDFIGELDFMGKDSASWKGITSPYLAAKDGLLGLFNLATACEQNDPQLDGLTVFGGKSQMLNSKFEKLGFKIFEFDKIKRKSFFTPVSAFLLKLGRGDFHKYPNGARLEGKYNVGVITRESLIQNKNIYARLARVGSH